AGGGLAEGEGWEPDRGQAAHCAQERPPPKKNKKRAGMAKKGRPFPAKESGGRFSPRRSKQQTGRHCAELRAKEDPVKKTSTLAKTALVLLCGLSGDAVAQYPSGNSNPNIQSWNRFDGRRDEDDRRHSSHSYQPFIPHYVHIPHLERKTPEFKVPTRSSSVGTTGAFSRSRGWLAGLGAALGACFSALFGRRKKS